jgi:stearoyl-CoA desaturase (Delta-9 desaturase)
MVMSKANRIANLIGVIAPVAGVVAAIILLWNQWVDAFDLALLAVTYLLSGLGITVGYHRLLTHRAFATHKPLEYFWASLGCMAVEGSPLDWVADHRKHHAHPDQEGDPHSPHVGHGSSWRGAVGGLLHAHVGWILRGDALANEERYAKDLLADPVVRFVDRWFVLWVILGLAFPFGLGVALTGTLAGGLTAMLWGGAVRMFLLHHATFSINSLCHFFGRKPFQTGDESRNLAWLALPTLGEAWHNNHHAFPTSARHGQARWQLDPSWWVIGALARCGLAWDVVGVSSARRLEKRAA